MQLERLLARQMEILQDAAVQERLQALDWRFPPAALKYLSDIQSTNGAEASRDSHGRWRRSGDGAQNQGGCSYTSWPHGAAHTPPQINKAAVKKTKQGFDVSRHV